MQGCRHDGECVLGPWGVPVFLEKHADSYIVIGMWYAQRTIREQEEVFGEGEKNNSWIVDSNGLAGLFKLEKL